MRHIRYIPLILFISVLFIGGCIKEKNFPPQPVIEFDQFITYVGKSNIVDSADCIIKFQDGDGDIGIAVNDTFSKPNLRMKYLYKGTDGLFHPFDALVSTTAMDTLFFEYRIPNITPNGQYKALDGTIKAKLRTSPVFFPTHKVVKFEIILTDRAGNHSNMVSTNEIQLP